MTPEFMEALLAGRLDHAADHLRLTLPDGPVTSPVERFLSYRLEQMRRDPAVQRWLARAVVLRDAGRLMVGNAGFHGEPGVNSANAADAVEIGYAILPRYRRLGYATEAVEGLLGWARKQGIHHFVASVAPDNAPSLQIIRKLGFVRTGEHIDPEDGLEHVFELRD
jgi:[ribosomal protein S5]-alanine N-acetyltransferase